MKHQPQIMTAKYSNEVASQRIWLLQGTKAALEAQLEALLAGERARMEAALQLQHRELTDDLAQVGSIRCSQSLRRSVTNATQYFVVTKWGWCSFGGPIQSHP